MDLWDLKHHFELAVGLACPAARVQVAAGKTGWEAVTATGEAVGWAGALQADAPVWAAPLFGLEVDLAADRKSTRLELQSLRHLVCRLLLEKKKQTGQPAA